MNAIAGAIRDARIVYRYLVLPLLVSILLTACGSLAAARPLPFETLDQGSTLRGYQPDYSSDPLIRVIAAEQEVDPLLADIPVFVDVLERIEQVDYSKLVVILALQGYRGTGGYSIAIQEIHQRNNQIDVEATLREPGPEDGRTAAETDPYHIVTVSKEHFEQGSTVRFRLLSRGRVVAETSHTLP
jgi:hypothetical protein